MSRRLLLVGGSFTAPPPALYALYNGSKDGSTYSIGAASSADGGTTWTRYASNPVISAVAAWEGSVVKDPCLVWDGSQYVCYYSGYNGSNYAIGRATAPDYTGSWTKYGSNPVLTKGSGGAFDESGVRFPTILYEPSDSGHEWKCWYGADQTGHVGDGGGGIGYAYSADGLSWTKVGQVLAPTGAGWESVGVYPFGIVKSGSTYYLFYGGYPGGGYGWQGGVATFTDPAGTYTRGGSNPTQITRRAMSVSTSQLLTANTAAGSAIVTVGDTSYWNVNEALLLVDNNSESESHYISSIDSGTQITMDSVTSSAFTTANGATIRPFAFNSVVPRSILSLAGTLTMFGTPFQGQNDLSPGGTTLREGTLRWTAAALDGAWSYDYTPAGLLLPLYPARLLTDWDGLSSENPSVILAP